MRVAIAAVLASLVIVSSASAQDRIYWTSFDTGKVEWANLDGSGGTHELNASGVTIVESGGYGYGMGGAIDPVQQRYYWANQAGSKIVWANLDGSGGGELPTGAATVSSPDGISVDPVGRRVYWSNSGDKISFADLDGGGGGDLATTSASVASPHGTTVYPALGRIYWTNWSFITGSLAFARTDGSGGETLPITGATVDTPFGIAIDAGANKLYWVNDNPGIVSVANLDGSNAADIDNRGLQMKGPYGIALDPEAGRVYTANFAGNDLTYIGVDGSGGATVPVKLTVNNGPNFPVLLKDPRANSALTAASITHPMPKVSRAKGKRNVPSPLPKLIGSRISCSGGSFAPDLVEARLYRAPATVAHVISRDGERVTESMTGLGPEAGMVRPPLVASKPGNYRCQVTGTNAAGSTTQTSTPVAIFAAGKLTLNKKKGTAKLAVALPAEKGTLKLVAKGFKALSKKAAAGKVSLLVKPKGPNKAKLLATGKLKAVVKLTYRPPDGPAATLRKRVTLKQG